MLVFLEAGDRPASDVAALLDVVPSTVTSVVDGLCGPGPRGPGHGPSDRRKVVLSLTDEGRAQVAEGDRVVAARLGHLLDRLPETRPRGRCDGLESLNRAMEDYLDGEVRPAPRERVVSVLGGVPAEASIGPAPGERGGLELGWMRRMWPILRPHRRLVAGSFLVAVVALTLQVAVPGPRGHAPSTRPSPPTPRPSSRSWWP